MKHYRCPVMDQLRERNLGQELREFRGSHDEAEVRKWINDHDQCDQEAEFVRFIAEEIIVPPGLTDLDQLPRTGKGHLLAIGTQRNILVRCPIHGEQIFLHHGSHITVKLNDGPLK